MLFRSFFEIKNIKLPKLFSIVRHASRSPRRSLTSESDILQFMSPGQQRNLRRHLRQEGKQLSFEVEGIDALGKVIAIERASYRPIHGMDFFGQELAESFIRHLERQLPGSISISTVNYNSKPIATILGFMSQNIFYWYHTAYLEEFRSIGAGKIALYLTIQHFHKLGFVEINLLRGESQLKLQFANQLEVHNDIYLSKNVAIIFWWNSMLLIWNLLKDVKGKLIKISRRFGINKSLRLSRHHQSYETSKA